MACSPPVSRKRSRPRGTPCSIYCAPGRRIQELRWKTAMIWRRLTRPWTMCRRVRGAHHRQTLKRCDGNSLGPRACSACARTPCTKLERYGLSDEEALAIPEQVIPAKAGIRRLWIFRFRRTGMTKRYLFSSLTPAAVAGPTRGQHLGVRRRSRRRLTYRQVFTPGLHLRPEPTSHQNSFLPRSARTEMRPLRQPAPPGARV